MTIIESLNDRSPFKLPLTTPNFPVMLCFAAQQIALPVENFAC